MALKHIEVDGCIVNIQTKLHDRLGREVTSIQIIPDRNYNGEIWKYVPGKFNHRVIKLKKSKQFSARSCTEGGYYES